MKIYTRAGDQGETALFGGKRVAKDHRRIAAYGTIDELNAVLGVVRAEVAIDGDPGGIDPQLYEIQNQLFSLGAELSTPSPEEKGTDLLTDRHVEALERAIDKFEEGLLPLDGFILPGGSRLAAELHVARCVCRRAERLTVTLGREESVRAIPMQYLNRLSDLLFVLARVANHASGVGDVGWKK